MARDDVLFRGTRDGLLIVLNDEKDFEHLKRRLIERLEQSGSFFEGAEVTLDVGNLILTPAQLVEVEETMSRKYGVHLGRVVRGREEEKGVRATAGSTTESPGALKGVEERPTLLVKRTLRSGQSVRFDGNVVVLGDIHPGSEVVATGDIVVMGSAAGVVHAGAGGNEEAIVAALKLVPVQLRIAGRITRPPDSSAPRGPELARITGDHIVVEALPWGF